MLRRSHLFRRKQTRDLRTQISIQYMPSFGKVTKLAKPHKEERTSVDGHAVFPTCRLHLRRHRPQVFCRHIQGVS